jgi:ElaB/YqjD/DUF883 family membrane-anchored ribosome-binding protein
MTSDEMRKMGTRSKKKLLEIKENLGKYGKKTEQYVEKNPKKALAMAAAAGTLIGTFWSALKMKKPVQKKRKPKPTPAV